MTDRETMLMALETAEQIACADYRHGEELASLGEFENGQDHAQTILQKHYEQH